MKPYHSIELIDGICFITFFKSPTPNQYCRVVDQVARLAVNRYRLWDLSCGITWSTEEIDRITKYCDATLTIPWSKIAIVAPDDLTFGLYRVHGAYRESSNHEQVVFRKKGEAVQWLYEQKSNSERP